MEIRFTLLGDGVFDAALSPIIRWALRQHQNVAGIAGEFADPSRLPRPAEGLAARISAAVDLYPCNILFVHRDAENQQREHRLSEIKAALSKKPQSMPWVPIIPIRMTEAWLLFSDQAIRAAAGNPSGRMSLNLPSIQRLESRPDPKSELYQALKIASGRNGRRLASFDEKAAAKRVAELIDDYSPLRPLSAFHELETDISSSLLTLSRPIHHSARPQKS